MALYTLLTLFGLVTAQTLSNTSDVHPKLTTWTCTKAQGCKQQTSAIVLDSSRHPIYQKNNDLTNNTSKGCGQGNSLLDPIVCPDVETCAEHCIIDAIQNYTEYGVLTQGSAITLNMSRKSGVSSPRVYLLNGDEKNYEKIQLTGNEFSFTVDASKLPCGMNGALYMSEMDADGGGGAAVGNGYCDAQCLVKPWINGEANIKSQGACCSELDIWEANKRSTQIAPHTCSKPGLYRCNGEECTKTGVCAKNGCHNNPYHYDKSFYAPASKQVDTNRPFTVVTQFPAKDGVLQSIMRKYVQDGRVIEDAATVKNITINDAHCTAEGSTEFMNLGGIKGMGEAMSRGMVLVMSLWWDDSGFMNWLDSGSAGPCNTTEGDPKVIVQNEKSPSVIFSEIKWGEIGSTFGARTGALEDNGVDE